MFYLLIPERHLNDFRTNGCQGRRQQAENLPELHILPNFKDFLDQT